MRGAGLRLGGSTYADRYGAGPIEDSMMALVVTAQR